MDMTKYFETNIGKTIRKSFRTGENFFTEIFERRYSFEILAIEKGEMMATVTSVDIVSSGMMQGGSKKDFGEITVRIKNRSREEILRDLALNADPHFFTRYSKQLKAKG